MPAWCGYLVVFQVYHEEDVRLAVDFDRNACHAMSMMFLVHLDDVQLLVLSLRI